MSKRDEAVHAMNTMGKARRPFFVLVDFNMEEPLVLPAEEAEHHGVLLDFGNFRNVPVTNTSGVAPTLVKQPVRFEVYQGAFDKVQHHLNIGNSYLVNLTFSTPIRTDLSLDEIFARSTARYKVLVKDRFVVFSPEIFVKIVDGVISSYPMKGTIDAGQENAEMLILDDEKELAEHTTIVDLIRNDLSIVAKNVRVERFRYIERISTNEKELLQVSSHIAGQLPDDYHAHIGTILFSLLPAGSVTGAPKKKTVEIIRSVETYERGFYTGVAGYFDGKNFESCVLIRFIEQTPGGLVYKSGGGITVASSAEREYQELLDKVYVPIV